MIFRDLEQHALGIVIISSKRKAFEYLPKVLINLEIKSCQDFGSQLWFNGILMIRNTVKKWKTGSF